MLEIGQIIDGKYKILNVIGKGGMSVVYLAMNEKAGKQWAIKEVRKDGKQDFNVVKQGLVAELGMLKRLNHPNLPSIIDVIDGDDTFLIVMDYIEGVSLEQRLKEKGAQSQENVIQWAMELCDVLGYLHSRTPPIIYRDMKPANVMLKPDGHVTLIDFGTAREFKDTSVEDTTCLGTRGYAAPEQFGGQGQTDARTDIYCLGATMYHLITGHNPSAPPYEMYPIRQWNSAFSPSLERIILTCTQQNPASRYQTCAELMVDLERIIYDDEHTREKQLVKWKVFLSSIIASVFMGACALTFGLLERSKTADTYESYIKNAAQQQTLTDAFDLFNNAVDLQPDDPEAYNKMLDYVLEDSLFTPEESSKVTAIVNNSAYADAFRKGAPLEYAKFCYEMGVAYYFSYRDDVNEQYSLNGVKKSASWFNSAVSIAEFQSDPNSKKAEILHTMAINGAGDKWGNSIGITGDIDENSSYHAYWADIKGLVYMNLFDTENVSVALSIYKNFAVVMQINAQSFAKDPQVTQDDMTALLDKMKGDITPESLNTHSTYVQGIHDAIAAETDQQIETARSYIYSAFSSSSAQSNTGTEAAQ